VLDEVHEQVSPVGTPVALIVNVSPAVTVLMEGVMESEGAAGSMFSPDPQPTNEKMALKVPTCKRLRTAELQRDIGRREKRVTLGFMSDGSRHTFQVLQLIPVTIMSCLTADGYPTPETSIP
jgi:hypothetical protein